MSLNKVILVGRLGKNPEVRDAGGNRVAKFSIATSERFKNKAGEQQEKTDWHNIVVWGKLADVCGQYLIKGSEACIEGKISTRSYEDKNGVTKYITEIVASNVQFLGGRPVDPSSQDADPELKSAEYTEDEIPF